MASLQHTSINTAVLCKKGAFCVMGVSALPSSLPRVRTFVGFARGNLIVVLSGDFILPELEFGFIPVINLGLINESGYSSSSCDCLLQALLEFVPHRLFNSSKTNV